MTSTAKVRDGPGSDTLHLNSALSDSLGLTLLLFWHFEEEVPEQTKDNRTACQFPRAFGASLQGWSKTANEPTSGSWGPVKPLRKCVAGTAHTEVQYKRGFKTCKVKSQEASEPLH